MELLLGLHDPMQFSGDADPIQTRFRADPSAALAAEVNGELVGSNFMADWGSVGVFGPLSVYPDLWNKGIAKHIGASDCIKDLVFGRFWPGRSPAI